VDETPPNPSSVRLQVLEELVHAMRAALYMATQTTNANANEVFSSVFSLTLRTMEAAIDLHRHNRQSEFLTRKELTIMCEKLWMTAAGEHFKRNKAKTGQASRAH